MRVTAAIYLLTVTGLLLAGCTTSQTDAETAPTTAAPPAPAPQQEHTQAPPGTLTASGTITSPTGDVSGRFEAEALVTPPAHDTEIDWSPSATVEFFDLVFPYDHLAVGGALYPRGDDPCFDEGLRSGGGTISPGQNGFATTTLPFDGEGYELSELILHLDWTQIDPEMEACLQPVVARAPLIWEE